MDFSNWLEKKSVLCGRSANDKEPQVLDARGFCFWVGLPADSGGISEAGGGLSFLPGRKRRSLRRRA